MKSTVLLVVASIHLGGSYYNQTALSSVLSKFEAQLTVPRRKDAEQTAPVTSTAPAATPLLRADATLTSAVNDGCLCGRVFDRVPGDRGQLHGGRAG